ncbi:phosphatase PAP2 family protein [Knoellia sp. Soil729]|uniref:phosphatase PAP2 family protein n=1 Tax=Knoellia sp. Soil729 TaxID=1736394 RepID=UPI0006F4EEEC|nr:phosphatase PAP2 family protein [Knoellia sp. Soil729]KRE42597.1 hypothetical protein ASG74_09415 [Knoellia sp. Soil729]
MSESTSPAPAESVDAPGGVIEGLEARPAWAQLLIALSPLSVILAAYAVAQWLTAPISHGRIREGDANRLGAGLHVSGPAGADGALFGEVPTVWLQERLAGQGGHWYDALASVVYLSHYIVLPLVTAYVWFRLRDEFRAWIRAVLMLTVGAMTTYVLYPAAPPWLASDLGVVASVERLSASGWDHLGLGGVGSLLASTQAGSNPVAAMPSLHAAVPVLIAVFMWSVSRRRWRLVACAYAVAMALTLVYTGEHYVVDVAAGSLAALVAALAGRATTTTK